MNKGLLVGLLALTLAGCATAGRNYQPDIDDLNTKNESLQSQLESKNREIGNLQDQLRAMKSQLEQANRAKQESDSKLYQALEQLSQGSGSSSTSTTAKPKQSYIK